MADSIVFLGTGGTIAGSASSAQDNLSYTSGRVALGDLLAALPGLPERLGGHDLRHEQVFQEDSKDLDPGHWQVLGARVAHHLDSPTVRGVVLTHGTDTLEETAFFLARTLPASLLAAKPVVMTCAMRPATSHSPDGPQNLRDATVLACTQGAHGVMLVCQGQVFDGARVQKNHPYQLNPFDAAEYGLVGVVEEMQVRLLGGWPRAMSGRAVQTLPAKPGLDQAFPRVEIVFNHNGADGAMVRALCAPPLSGDAPVQGIVLAGTGNGTVHRGLEAALQKAQSQGVTVVRTTRCARGRVLPRADGRGQEFPILELSPVKARIELMLQLAARPVAS